MKMNIETLLAEIERLDGAATKGPWQLKWDWPKEGDIGLCTRGILHPVNFMGITFHEMEDTEFITRSRTLLPLLALYIKKYREDFEKIENGCRYWRMNKIAKEALEWSPEGK